MYNEGKSNVVVDALSRRSYLLSMVDARNLGFEHLKKLYVDNVNFGESFKNPNGMFVIQEGFLFTGNKLCIPKMA